MLKNAHKYPALIEDLESSVTKRSVARSAADCDYGYRVVKQAPIGVLTV